MDDALNRALAEVKRSGQVERLALSLLSEASEDKIRNAAKQISALDGFIEKLLVLQEAVYREKYARSIQELADRPGDEDFDEQSEPGEPFYDKVLDLRWQFVATGPVVDDYGSLDNEIFDLVRIAALDAVDALRKRRE